MPVDGTEGEASGTAKGVVTIGIDDGIRRCGRWCGDKGGLAVAAVVRDG